ncbi:MAG TPA: flagellar biosynthesis anti-sigma factor FlgM [Solirubrobacterales bacterium]|nr:flagellar biosynthesis anti-sigma factor FlgM [Solirubrobacterales bacterium]
MQLEQLKSMVEAGRYRPEPGLVAEAMLRRRGVRELLIAAPTPFKPAGRTPRLPAARRQAA